MEQTKEKRESDNKYIREFCRRTESGILEDAVDAIAALNDSIASAQDDFKISDKREVIEFTDWFYRNANTEELQQAVLERWPEYPELFHLAGDYTLEGDLAMARQVIDEMTGDQKAFYRHVMDYLWKYDTRCFFHFWAGKEDYFETGIPKKEDFPSEKKQQYYRNVVKVWTVRVISLGGTIVFRRELEDGRYAVCGFVSRKGKTGIISAQGLEEALCSGGVLSAEQMEGLVFEQAAF